jgi:hypothetical protein
VAQLLVLLLGSRVDGTVFSCGGLREPLAPALGLPAFWPASKLKPFRPGRCACELLVADPHSLALSELPLGSPKLMASVKPTAPSVESGARRPCSSTATLMRKQELVAGVRLGSLWTDLACSSTSAIFARAASSPRFAFRILDTFARKFLASCLAAAVTTGRCRRAMTRAAQPPCGRRTLPRASRVGSVEAGMCWVLGE